MLDVAGEVAAAVVRIIDLGGQSLRSIENTPAWYEVFLANACIDGIVGAGAHGPLTGALTESVELLNRLSAIKPRPVMARSRVRSCVPPTRSHAKSRFNACAGGSRVSPDCPMPQSAGADSIAPLPQRPGLTSAVRKIL